jgi:hypothetical protein
MASWTLQELEARVAEALERGYDGPISARVRAVPDDRTIRYYTTLGLLDRPAMQGRTALYGPRHLRQVVAIKRLQARGLPLADIQRELAGITDAALAKIARVPAEALRSAPAPGPAAAPGRGDFWREPPSPPRHPAAPAPAAPALTPPVAVGVPLEPDVTLLVAGARVPTGADLDALRAAAAPLLRALDSLGLRCRKPGANGGEP